LLRRFASRLQRVKDRRPSAPATVCHRAHQLGDFTWRDTRGCFPEHAEVHAEEEQAAARRGERAHIVQTALI